MDEFTFLEHWQKYTCNQESSEDIGSVEVASCDNPGWWVKIDLKKTKFEHCAFEVISRNGICPVSPMVRGISRWSFGKN